MSEAVWSDAAAPAAPVSNEAEYLAAMRLRRALRATATTFYDEEELAALEQAIESYESRRMPLTLSAGAFQLGI